MQSQHKHGYSTFMALIKEIIKFLSPWISKLWAGHHILLDQKGNEQEDKV